MRLTLSKRILIILITIALFITALNTYLIFTIQRDSTFNYVVFAEGDNAKAKSQTSGFVEFSSTDAGIVISQAIAKGNSVFVKPGTYHLMSNIQILNQKSAKLEGDDATLIGNGHSIIIKGDNYTVSKYSAVSGFTIFNGSVRIENSFATAITEMNFEECSVALEFANTNTWTEGSKIDNIHFINCTQAIVFRTPVEPATGSYASTQISRCYFNQRDNSIGISVEPDAEFSDCQLINSRMWLGEYGVTNQTGLLVDGSMFKTLLSSVVFESFATFPQNMYAINIGDHTNPAPILNEGISFLGNWTARVFNPNNVWLSGAGGVFRRSEEVPIGVSNHFGNGVNIQMRPATITGFKPRIQVQGTLGEGETVTVRVRLEFVDNVISQDSQSVIKTFTNTTATWLTDDDLLRLFPSQDVIWAILVDAKTSSPSTLATVKVDVYGTST